MESSHQANKITGRLLLVLMFVLLGYAALTHYSSFMVRNLAAHRDADIQIFIATKPAMTVAYNPINQKAHITVLSPEETDPSKQMRCISGQRCVPHHVPGRFFNPKETRREPFWEQFKQNLTSWRYDPLIIAQTMWSYLTALHEKRTNLSPAEFILLSLEMIKLEPSDFAITLPPPPKKRGRAKEPTPAPQVPAKTVQPAKDRPLILEIFNASGKKGLALELTQYLREKNQKGLLRVDVFSYENYPSIQETSWLEDYSGRMGDVKQLSHALGINAEIRTGTSANVMCDTRIIIGKDFTVPL
jgi:hypothetical protein